MTILILQGPHPGQRPLGEDISNGLRQLARAAGRTLSISRCAGLRELVGSIRSASRADTEFMLIDPGELAEQAREHPEEGLQDALAQLDSPYIDVHADSATTLETTEPQHGAPLATIVINGDLATSYRIALAIALRRLAA
ncbi:type II 3-dehydroquinate dehydratase [Dyella solisilvae]|nr:type II 3-dehydroquinate dehydratase [Dyella solisilvae]